MANTNAPYGFRLYEKRSAGTGAASVAPGIAPALPAGSTFGPIKFPSAASLKVGDPVKVSAGLGYIASGTNAIFGICNQVIPGYGETATQFHYPEILPADDNTVFRVQNIGTTNVTIGYIGVASKKYRIGGTTSGYTGIDVSHTTGGVLEVVGLAPGSALGTYAELLVIVTRGAFYGAA
jgi:hypothetical protein